MTLLPYADELPFEYVECIYAHCVLNHEGQFSPKYSIMSRCTFRPAPMWKAQDCEETLAYEHVAALTDEELSQALDECLRIIESSR